MAKVRSQCGNCGAVEVACSSVTVIRRRSQPGAEYNFECPHCAGVVSGLLRPDTALQLVAEGARLLEVDEPVDRPITLEEIDAFRVELEEPGALERELASLRG